ncbi:MULTISPECIES: isocitrate lyase/PEP mutase family protein [Thiorhodovibrio]|uniref:isocitrate lyase/PEP mutase family protein n=1 Tax=Thiorhodovibrio TaxID=61593 RepID=UPI001913BF35|nr:MULTISPECIES: isocitrate lyase/PEP mutase family protein [Thiorhodovibrio]WPL12207.1 2,3-dimethylmalate lyase [Thiorhodovibrio litoralis]
MTPAQRFRALVADPKILQLPACHDGLSARVLEQAGFQAIAAAGFGLSGSLLGMPDIGLLSGREMIDQYRNICAALSIPVFVDIDTGFGDLNNVIRTVREVEATGAAGLFIEDQTYPKRCGHMQGKQVVPVEEYLPKLKAALWARRDPDFVIMARTDAYSVLGLEEALRRARLYAQAGADMLFVEAVDDPDAMRTVNQALRSMGVPSMANMIEGGRSPFLSAAELQDIGNVWSPIRAVHCSARSRRCRTGPGRCCIRARQLRYASGCSGLTHTTGSSGWRRFGSDKLGSNPRLAVHRHADPHALSLHSARAAKIHRGGRSQGPDCDRWLPSCEAVSSASC